MAAGLAKKVGGSRWANRAGIALLVGNGAPLTGLPEIEAKLGPTTRIAPRRSGEIYLLSFATPHSAKIRGGALEVKRLLQVASSGLEQWTLAFKERFPLSAPMLRSAFAALDLRPIATRRDVYDFEEFLSEAGSNGRSRCGPLR